MNNFTDDRDETHHELRDARTQAAVDMASVLARTAWSATSRDDAFVGVVLDEFSLSRKTSPDWSDDLVIATLATALKNVSSAIAMRYPVRDVYPFVDHLTADWIIPR